MNILNSFPIFFPIHSGGGGGSINGLLGILVILNILYVLYCLVLATVWIIKERKSRYRTSIWRYVFWNEDCEMINMFSLVMTMINGIVLLMWCGEKVGNLLF